MRKTNHDTVPSVKKKKRLKVTRLPAKKVFESGAETGLAKHDDGRNTGDSIEESQPLDEEK